MVHYTANDIQLEQRARAIAGEAERRRERRERIADGVADGVADGPRPSWVARAARHARRVRLPHAGRRVVA